MTTMGYKYQSDFARRNHALGKVEGKAEGRAESLLVVLRARGIAVDDEHRALIVGCTDDAQLDNWLQRAVGAEKIQDLGDEFAG